jgi:hypothetical protein
MVASGIALESMTGVTIMTDTQKTYFAFDCNFSAQDALDSATSTLVFLREITTDDRDELTLSGTALEGLNVILRSATNAIQTATEEVETIAADSYKRAERFAKDEYVRGELDGYAKALVDLNGADRITLTDDEKERCLNSVAPSPEQRERLAELGRLIRTADKPVERQSEEGDTFPKLKENGTSRKS